MKARYLLKPLILAVSTACLLPVLPSSAEALSARSAAGQQIAAEIFQVNISAGSLAEALNQLARQAGEALSYEPALVAGKSTQGANGRYTLDEALQQLLRDTGLQAKRHGRSGGYVIVTAADTFTLAPIHVEAFGRQGSDRIKDIPQSIAVYGEETLEIGASETVGDILRLVPNASPAGSSLDMFADDYFIRGFRAEQSANGLGFIQTDHPTDLANVERIEVLKGPSSVLYGQMEPGGTINVVTKQPLAYSQVEAGLEFGSYDRRRATLDVTGPLTDSVRGRLNLAHQVSDSFVDNLDYERLFIAPNITIDLSDKTNLTIEGSYSKNTWTALYGGAPIEGALISNPNGKYDKSFNVSSQDSFTERDSLNANIRLTHALTDKINARASYTYVRNEADWEEYAPFGLAGDSRTLNRIIFVGDDTYKQDHNLILDLNGEFNTSSLVHKFIVGLDYSDGELSRPTRVHAASSIDLFNPQYATTDLDMAFKVRDRGTKQDDEVLAVFLQDRITVADRWHILTGLRYIDSEQTQTSVDNLAVSTSTDKINQTDWVSQVGLVYDVSDTTSLFANRSESFVPQQGTSAGRRPLDAEESTQYELGIRFNVGDLEVNAAGFVITKDNIAIDDPLNPGFEIAAGEARSKGVEISVGGYLAPNWYMSAAYGYTDTEILRSDDATLEGNRFASIPLNTATLQSRYYIDQVPGLSFGGSVVYMDERFGDDNNSFTLPSHTRADLGVYYVVNDAIQIDLLVDNVFDEEIFSQGAFSGVVREPERTYLARMKLFF